MFIVKAIPQTIKTINGDKAYGVWFENRRTPIVVDAENSKEAIPKARKKKKRGGNKVERARLLNESERKTASSGRWVRTGKNGEKAGYNPNKKGSGVPPGGY